jgi:hypothetical protein
MAEQRRAEGRRKEEKIRKMKEAKEIQMEIPKEN